MSFIKKIPTILAGLAIACAGIVIGSALSKSSSRTSNPALERKVVFYQDSMHPWVKSDHAGKCAVCGMDLTPIYEGQAAFGTGEGIVALTSNNITVLNVQTEEARPARVARTLQVAGTLEPNETRKTIVAAPAAGRIDDLTVKYAGVEVREGERLVTFYSPELTLEKRRFLVRARMSVQRDPTGGLAQQQTDSDPYYSDLVSPQSGTVVERNIYKGQYVTDGEKLFTIVDLSTVWFRFDIYEQQLPWVAVGQTVDVSVSAVPGKVFPATITFIEPMLNESARTIRVRAELQNPVVEVNGNKQRLLALGMYAQGGVRAEFQPSVAVPRSAVLFTGHSAFAYVGKGSGAFEMRRLKLGRQGDESWEVLSGLETGERVVTSGNVLIDAQAQFNRAGDRFVADAEMVAQQEESVRLPVAAAPIVVPAPVAHAQMPEMASSKEKDPPKPERMMPAPAVAEMPVSTNSTKVAWRPRGPAHKPKEGNGPGYRSNRLGPYDAAFDAAFNRVAELRNSEVSEAKRAAVPNSSGAMSAQIP